jgi:serine phosphatase RsbU (regulator of sigma subunit)/signal transduction histidine kinase
VRILIVTVATLLVAVIVTTAAAVTAIRRQAEADMTRYRAEELTKTKEKLKNLVDVAYAAIEGNHREAQDREFVERIHGRRLKDVIGIAEPIVEEMIAEARAGRLTEDEAKTRACAAIRKIRYDNGTGYIWINDTGKPYPTMIMHAVSSELDNSVLDDPRYNCAQGTNKNLFQAAVEECEARGEGFVDYRWPKPKPGGSGLTPDVPKLSYVKLIEPWGWILGTGVYIDDVLVAAARKSTGEIRKMRYDHGTGYFWINDTGRPFPKMITHPLSPELEGRVLDDPDYDCALGTNENLFRAFVDVCETDGAGFVDYRWPQPTAEGLTEPVPKLSYVRLYEPLGWIVGTGVYLDEIDAAIRAQTEAMTTQVNVLIGKIVVFSAIMCLLAVVASAVSAKSVAGPVGKLIETMKEIRREGLSTRRVSPSGASELRQLGGIFNGMLDAIDEAVEKLTRETAARERMQRDLDIARSVQQGLLPARPPQIEGFEIAGWSQPADETGGDYFDWQQLADGRLAISLADVTGHGIGPALVTAVCRAYSRASFPSGEALGTLVDRINELLVEDLPSDRFVTFVVALLDPGANRVQWLSAGHGPLLVYTAADDRVQDFSADDIPFGIASGVRYGPPQEITLAPGDLLVMITDGFFEWANPAGKMYGTARLREAVRAASSLPPEEIVKRLHSAVVDFAGGTEQADDLTAVVLKRTRSEGQTV